MQIHSLHLDPAAWRHDLLLLFAFSNEPVLESTPNAVTEITRAAPWFVQAPGLDDFKGKPGELFTAYGPLGSGISRILLAGLGKRESFNLDAFRKAAGAAVRHCAKLGITDICVGAGHLEYIALQCPAVTESPDACRLNPERPGPRRLAEELAFAAQAAAYHIDQYKSPPAADAPAAEKALQPENLTFFFADEADPELEAAAKRGAACGSGVALARDLANGPANVVTPAYMADAARGLAARHGFNCRVYDAEECRAMGMGAFMAVAAGAGFDPCLIVLEHTPPGTEKDAPVVLVGKGITFDTGGISLKPSAGIAAMKSDMAGAAAVLGVFDILGRESTPRRVVGIMPCTENMPDARATRPGDIVTALSGTTIEITNTDAEGRLLLCDALTFAQNEYSPAALVDIATLTGACIVALGKDAAGLFTRHGKLADAIQSIGLDRGERYWPMPLWDSFKEAVKSDTADIVNAGAREGGAIFAGLFLEHFVKAGIHWAHLDIAGPGFTDKAHALGPKGATGFGVRTLFELARTWTPD